MKGSVRKKYLLAQQNCPSPRLGDQSQVNVQKYVTER